MTLDDWMSDEDISDARLARDLRLTRGTIGRIRRSERDCSAVLALLITHRTGGSVLPRDLPMTESAREDLEVLASVPGILGRISAVGPA